MGAEASRAEKVHGLAKDKKKKPAQGKTDRPAAKSESAAPQPESAHPPRRHRVSKAVKATKAKAAELAANPALTEVVAATLVAAAAALRSPQKARAMAATAAEDLQSAAAQTKGKGGALWQLALDIARRSLEAAGGATDIDAPRQKKRKAGKKKKKAKV